MAWRHCVSGISTLVFVDVVFAAKAPWFVYSDIQYRCILAAENLALRQQRMILKRNQNQTFLKERDRLFCRVLSNIWPSWRDSLIIVQPRAVIAWHRTTFRLYLRSRSRGGNRGRPKLDVEVKSLVLKKSAANPLWGAPRIHGELSKLGIGISEQSVSGIIHRNGPKPPSQTWKTFIKNHMTDMVAVDFSLYLRYLGQDWSDPTDAECRSGQTFQVLMLPGP